MNLILPPPLKEEIDKSGGPELARELEKTGYLGQEKKEAVGA